MTASTWESDKKDNRTLQTSVTDNANVGGCMSSFSDADSYKFQTAGTLFLRKFALKICFKNSL